MPVGYKVGETCAARMKGAVLELGGKDPAIVCADAHLENAADGIVWGGFALLLPWDPAYADGGTGDSAPMPADHPLATGPSRLVLEERTWKNITAPSSTPAA